MLEPNEFRNEVAKERDESKKEVLNILNHVDYSINELNEIPKPKILVLGTGPHFPEAYILKEWSESNQKEVNLDCVDKEDIDKLYVEKILNLENSNYFKMNLYKNSFEDFDYSSEYDLVLLLRYSNFSLINEDVFAKISDCLKKGSFFIMSGGITNSFLGTSINESDLALEKKSDLEYSLADFYRSYAGKNIALKFRKA